jgi:hypothetical protein
VARINLARAYYEKREYSKANTEFLKVIKKKPGYASLYGYLSLRQDVNKKENGKKTSFQKIRSTDIEDRMLNNVWSYDEN